jgi:hypothetical protein
MHPAWARKFEPPAITGGESQGAIETLFVIYRETGQTKYLEPVARAIAYLRRSQLPDGRLARFYELKTNPPLYFTRDYQLTYDDRDVPTHYAFKVGHRLDALERQYQRLRAADPKDLRTPHRPTGSRGSPRMIDQVRKVIADLDDQGRWVETKSLAYHGPQDPTRRVIDCGTFVRNMGVLSAYLAALKPAMP